MALRVHGYACVCLCVCTQVTAPVRETAAQALAFALSPLSPDTVMHILSVLEQLQKHNEWAVR